MTWTSSCNARTWRCTRPSGRGVDIAVYDAANDPYDVSQLGLLVELRRAIEQDELTLHYQPKIDLVTGDLQGVEALVRWAHPTRGLIPPGDFIPLAENTALMQPLSEWVLRHAIAQAAQWRDAGLMIAVAVNISPRSLLDRDLPVTVLRLLADASLPAHLLELEITETAIMTDPTRATQVLRRLQAMGVRVALDDFGVGYTSLAYLKPLPVNTLKIERCFIAEILHSGKDQAIAEAVIGLGHKLSLTVLAEGIESEAVLDRLKSLNCDEGQGYHLGRPMPPEQLNSWVRNHVLGTATRSPRSHRPDPGPPGTDGRLGPRSARKPHGACTPQSVSAPPMSDRHCPVGPLATAASPPRRRAASNTLVSASSLTELPSAPHQVHARCTPRASRPAMMAVSRSLS